MKLITLLMIGLSAVAVAESPNPDQAFFQKAAEGGMAEVETGKLAQSKGSSEAVKNFGAMMVKDHTAANTKLKKIAADKNVSLSVEPNAKHQAMKKKLEGLSGAAFDKAYIQGQIEDHEATVALFEREISSGKDPEAKAFASETLPTVKAHLKMVQQMTPQ